MTSSITKSQIDLNLYDSFMKRHLQHYGYYTGQNSKLHASCDNENMDNEESLSENSDQTVSDYEDANLPPDEQVDRSGDGSSTENKIRDELLRTTQIVYRLQSGKMVPQLKEPRQLYGLYTNLSCSKQPARWPAGIEVLNEHIRHIEATPKDPEPLYKPTGMETTPNIFSHKGEGRVVYQYEPSIGTYFLRSGSRSSQVAVSQVVVDLESVDDTTLIFESRFESGNLAKAVQIQPNEYELWLRNDLFTDKHTQWYYFRASNTRSSSTYRFTIVNLAKSDSLYNCGMKPLMYSNRQALEKGIGWLRVGSDIKYYKNNVTYVDGKFERSYYSLTWTCQLPHDRDTVYFAHCYPYTYSNLQRYLWDIFSDPEKSKICRQRLLCRSLGGNNVYMLTITSPTDNIDEIKLRKAIVLTARVHPGETNSSWIMKGLLDYLLGDSRDAKLLRDHFLFRVVPMLNPDGVIVGNYRCSLTGRDLNRNYKTVLKDSFPCIWYTKNMIKRLLEDREVILYCDFHGHSRRQNVFMYGCENKNNPQRKFHEQVFPYMLSRNAPDIFSFSTSKFHVQKYKEGTGRVVMWNLGIQNSYTLEATFCGSTLGRKKGFHYNMADFESISQYFFDTLLDYCDPDNTKVNVDLRTNVPNRMWTGEHLEKYLTFDFKMINVLFELEERMKVEILQRLRQLNAVQDMSKDISCIDVNKYCMSEIESSDGGSDSSASDSAPLNIQFVARSKDSSKKRLRSKRDRDRRKYPMSANKELKPSTPNVPEPQEKKPLAVAKTVKSARFVRTSCCNRQPKFSASEERDRAHGIPEFIQERLEDGNGKRANEQYIEAAVEPSIQDEAFYTIGHLAKDLPNFRYAAENRPTHNQSSVINDRVISSGRPIQGRKFSLSNEIVDHRSYVPRSSKFTNMSEGGIDLFFKAQPAKILDRRLHHNPAVDVQHRKVGQNPKEEAVAKVVQHQFLPDEARDGNVGIWKGVPCPVSPLVIHRAVSSDPRQRSQQQLMHNVDLKKVAAEDLSHLWHISPDGYAEMQLQSSKRSHSTRPLGAGHVMQQTLLKVGQVELQTPNGNNKELGCNEISGMQTSSIIEESDGETTENYPMNLFKNRAFSAVETSRSLRFRTSNLLAIPRNPFTADYRRSPSFDSQDKPDESCNGEQSSNRNRSPSTAEQDARCKIDVSRRLASASQRYSDVLKRLATPENCEAPAWKQSNHQNSNSEALTTALEDGENNDLDKKPASRQPSNSRRNSSTNVKVNNRQAYTNGGLFHAYPSSRPTPRPPTILRRVLKKR